MGKKTSRGRSALQRRHGESSHHLQEFDRRPSNRAWRSLAPCRFTSHVLFVCGCHHDFPLSPLRPPLLPSAFIGPTRCSAPGFITPVNENQLPQRKIPRSARGWDCAGFHQGLVKVVRVKELFFFCSFALEYQEANRKAWNGKKKVDSPTFFLFP